MVRDRILVGTRFSARPERPWGPPSPLYNGYRVFPGGRGGRGVGLTPQPPSSAEGPRKCRAIGLLTLRACVAYKKGVNLPTYMSVCLYFKLSVQPPADPNILSHTYPNPFCLCELTVHNDAWLCMRCGHKVQKQNHSLEP